MGDAFARPATVPNTHQVRIDFGKHAGELLTRVPVGYLRWMVNNVDRDNWAELAQAELDRRGHVLPEIDISGHAIDNASLRVRKIWHETRGEDEGLHSWLHRVSMEALTHGEVAEDREEVRFWMGMKLVFAFGSHYPTLKTVMRAKGRFKYDNVRENNEDE